MQRLVSLCARTSRLVQVVGQNHFKNNALTYPKLNYITSYQRNLATKNVDVDPHAELYKPSTDKKRQHISDDLKGGQPTDTIKSAAETPFTGGGKVWSTQNPDDIHVASSGRAQQSKFVSKTPGNIESRHETTVYTTQGELNIADPFKTHTLQPETTPQQLAEAAAASAFEPFAPDTPLASAPSSDPVFAPKISSTDIYSTTTSPTADFDAPVSPTSTSSSSHEPIKYETAAKGKVYGGQDTSAETKKHPKENPFNLKESIDPRQAK